MSSLPQAITTLTDFSTKLGKGGDVLAKLLEELYVAGKLVVGVADKKVTLEDAKFSVGKFEMAYLVDQDSFELSVKKTSFGEVLAFVTEDLGAGASSDEGSVWRHGQ